MSKWPGRELGLVLVIALLARESGVAWGDVMSLDLRGHDTGQGGLTAAAGIATACPGPPWTCRRPGPCGLGEHRGSICATGSAVGIGKDAGTDAGARATEGLCRAIRDRLTDHATRSGLSPATSTAVGGEIERSDYECRSMTRVVAVWPEPDGKRTHALAVVEGATFLNADRRVRAAGSKDRRQAPSKSTPVPKPDPSNVGASPTSAPAEVDIDRRIEEVVQAWERETVQQ